jgi:hypothetical protein
MPTVAANQFVVDAALDDPPALKDVDAVGNVKPNARSKCRKISGQSESFYRFPLPDERAYPTDAERVTGQRNRPQEGILERNSKGSESQR